MVLREPFVAHRSVEAFNIGVLLWLARFDVLKANAPRHAPGLDSRADVLRAVVAANDLRLATPGYDLCERVDHPQRGQRAERQGQPSLSVPPAQALQRRPLSACTR